MQCLEGSTAMASKSQAGKALESNSFCVLLRHSCLFYIIWSKKYVRTSQVRSFELGKKISCNALFFRLNNFCVWNLVFPGARKQQLLRPSAFANKASCRIPDGKADALWMIALQFFQLMWVLHNVLFSGTKICFTWGIGVCIGFAIFLKSRTPFFSTQFFFSRAIYCHTVHDLNLNWLNWIPGHFLSLSPLCEKLSLQTMRFTTALFFTIQNPWGHSSLLF